MITRVSDMTLLHLLHFYYGSAFLLLTGLAKLREEDPDAFGNGFPFLGFPGA